MRKKIVLGAIALASAVVLAGCSGGGGGGEPSEPAAIDGEGQELTVWVDANRKPAVEAAAAAFEEETGATVTLVEKNFGDLRNDFIAQVPTGEGPDITVGAHDFVGAFVAAGVVNTIDLGDKVSEFEPVAIDALTYDGQLYALPFAQEAVGLIQNVDLVGDVAPTTWDEMIQMGIDSGAERPFVISTSLQKGDAWTMYRFQTSFGAPILVQDDSGSYTDEVGMGGPAGEAFATWLGANGETGTGYISTTIDYDTNNELFNSGKAAFTVQGPWVIASYDKVPNLLVSPLPSAGGETAAPFVGVQGFYLSSQSKNTLLANEFLVNYLGTEEAQRALQEADPRIPVWSTVATEYASDPIVAGFLASAQVGLPTPSIPEMGAVFDYWNAAQSQIIAGADPVSTWNTMVTNVQTTVSGG